MKLNVRDIEKYLVEDEEDNLLEKEIQDEIIKEKLNKLEVKEKHADKSIYMRQDSKRRFKR